MIRNGSDDRFIFKSMLGLRENRKVFFFTLIACCERTVLTITGRLYMVVYVVTDWHDSDFRRHFLLGSKRFLVCFSKLLLIRLSSRRRLCMTTVSNDIEIAIQYCRVFTLNESSVFVIVCCPIIMI